MARDRRKEMLRIGVLLDECQICPKHNSEVRHISQVEAVCGGCSVFTELRQLGAGLQKPSTTRFQHILEKGEEMTKSEIAFLIENEVHMKDIQKALKMSTIPFYEMMSNYGFSKRKIKREVKRVAAVEGIKLTIEEYGDFKKQGLKDGKIAEKLGIKKQQLANWKYLRKDQLVKAGLANSKKQAVVSVLKPLQNEEPKAPPITEKQNEYAELINELSDALEEAKKKEQHSDSIILELEEKLKGYEELQDEYKLLIKRTGQHEGSYKEEIGKLHAACEDVEDELEKVRHERDQLIEQNYQSSYIIENQKQSIIKKNNQLEKLEEENTALRKLVHLWI